MKIIKFPTRLKIKTGNPVLDFYSKCLKSLGKPNILKNLDVTKFTVHQKDYKKLTKFMNQHFKNMYSGITSKRLSIEVGFFMLQFGPCERATVSEGSVLIDTSRLYVEEN
jgi:hypothetical protein